MHGISFFFCSVSYFIDRGFLDLLEFLPQDANNNQQRKYLMPRKRNESEKYHTVGTFRTFDIFRCHKMRIKCDVFVKLEKYRISKIQMCRISMFVFGFTLQLNLQICFIAHQHMTCTRHISDMSVPLSVRPSVGGILVYFGKGCKYHHTFSPPDRYIILVFTRAMLCIARSLPSCDVRPSLCLSVTRRYCV